MFASSLFSLPTKAFIIVTQPDQISDFLLPQGSPFSPVKYNYIRQICINPHVSNCYNKKPLMLSVHMFQLVHSTSFQTIQHIDWEGILHQDKANPCQLACISHHHDWDTYSVEDSYTDSFVVPKCWHLQVIQQ